MLESPYRDLRTAVWNRVESALPPLLDRLAYYGLSLTAPLVLREIDRIAPIEAIGGVPGEVPILILAGQGDRRARPAEAAALHDRVRDHGELAVFERTDHLRFLETQPERYRATVLGFLDRVLGGGDQASGVKPRMTSKRAASSPLRAPSRGLNGTVKAARALGSRRLR